MKIFTVHGSLRLAADFGVKLGRGENLIGQKVMAS